MLKWFNQLKNTGIRSTDNLLDKEYIRIVNETAIINTIAVIIIGIISFFLLHDIRISLLSLLCAAIFTSTIVLQYHRKIIAARMILLVLF